MASHQNPEEGRGDEEDMDRDWTVALLDKRDKADSDWRRGLGRAELSVSQKRKEKGADSKELKKKRRKYNNIGEDWGMSGIRLRPNGSTFSK